MKLLCTIFSFALLCNSLSAQIFSKKSHLKNADFQIPRSLETKFELNGGLIFIAAGEENEGMANLLLDTGAPTLILNQAVSEKETKLRVISVNGSCPITSKKLKNFKIQGMSIGKTRSYATDLSQLERIKKEKIGGIVGYHILKPFELFIDYERKYLMLFEPGASDLHSYIKPIGEIDFKLREHFPIVKVMIGNKKYYFGIDTGAEVNVINKRLKQKICRQIDFEKKTTRVHGIGGVSMVVEMGDLPEISVDQEIYEDVPFVFADLSRINSSTSFELDGILGFPFLSSGKFSINFKEGKLYQWDDPLEQANAIERVSMLEGK